MHVEMSKLHLTPDLPQTQILAGEDATTAQHKCQELQFQGVVLCHLLIEEKETWLNDKAAIVDCLKKIWMSETYHTRFKNVCKCLV